MENDIHSIALAYLALRIGALAAFGYLIYRVLKWQQQPVRIQSQSNYASERRRAQR